MSAIEAGQNTMVFYVKPDGTLNVLSSPPPPPKDPNKPTTGGAGAVTSRPEYKPDTITLKNTNSTFILNAPSTRTPIPYNQISAIWFTHGEQHSTVKEFRIYYVYTDTLNGVSTLREICKTGDGEWTQGTLDGRKIETTADSLISANHHGQHIRVHFQQGVKKQLWMVITPIVNPDWRPYMVAQNF
ncbi:hypothetical protein DIS24_g8421 [Lasiodiplodia hormozganensis]|uniref:Fucose-specific lectin n=1 Tax=Lasiodiplodia hormozganensis TaxID=869390 RepID=A0AA40CNH2_9PEZI|nr:hypothetical protein DIS24_g8421 [Lasiodiplodia hormozganensis]